MLKRKIISTSRILQTKFLKPEIETIDNTYLPFIPKLRKKPNAIVPLPDIFSQLDQKNTINDDLFRNHPELLINPYLSEINRFKPNLINKYKNKKIQLKSLNQSKFEYIDKLQQLEWLCDYLSKKNRSNVEEIGVDLEHHSERSYLGFTCLMQISTLDYDFIIDTIKLRSDIHKLNEAFTDPSLTKIMHGADCDIDWLQKDFGIYVVNLFDTSRAAIVLGYSKWSLSILLKEFFNVDSKKSLQLADWRKRPLNKDLVRYAQIDTHYLINIYEQFLNQLTEDKLKKVYEKSNNICKRTYKKPELISKNFMELCLKNSYLNSNQFKALYDLHLFRDKLARHLDESNFYVLSNSDMVTLAKELPSSILDLKHNNLFSLRNNLWTKNHVEQVNNIIKKAKEFQGKFTIEDIKNSPNKL